MKNDTIKISEELYINENYSILIEKIFWENIQINILGKIISKKNQELDLDKIEFLLFSPYHNKTISCKHTKINTNLSFNIRINIMSVDNLFPLLNGRWFIYSIIDNKKIYSQLDINLNNEINNFTRIYNYRASRYITRPFKTTPDNFFYIEIILYKISLKPKKRLKYLKSNYNVLIYQTLIKIFKKLKKKNGKRILFTSDSRAEISGNEKCVYDKLIERGLDKEYEILMSFKSNIKNKRNLLDKFKVAYYFAIADYIFVDDFQPIIYNTKFDKDTELIQLWHACGHFKTVGYSRTGKPGGPNPFSNNHKNYTKAIVSSDSSIRFYAEAFGIEEKNVIPTGVPRVDKFFDKKEIEHTKKDFYSEYPDLKDKEIILFAPTFRGHGVKTSHYDFDKIDFKPLAEMCRKRNAIVIFKIHPFVEFDDFIPDEYKDVCMDLSNYREINDMLFVTDILITDYSSVVFEYSILNRPMLFYTYDLEEYISQRDFYEEYTSFVPGKIVKTFSELVKSIENNDFEYEKVKKFKEKHFKFFDNKSSDRIIDYFILKNKIKT